MFRIQSLGGVVVRDASDRSVHLRSRKHLALLLYLSAGGRRVYTRDFLASLLWSTQPERARHSLSQAVYDLRRNLDGAFIRGPGDELRLDRSAITLDATEFEDAVKQGDLARAVELYSGPFAENLVGVGTEDYQRWLESERLRLTQLGQLALRRRTRECDETGRWGEMCVAALKLVELNSLDEDAHRALMRGLWLHGDTNAALRHFDEVVPMLEREMPGGVSEETVALARRIRSTHPPARSRVPAADSESLFVGREAEFDFLRSAIRDVRGSDTTVIVVYGEGGIGKTRLVREIARSIALDEIRLLESRCYPAESDVPYGPVVEGIRPIAAHLARKVSTHSSRFSRVGHLLAEFEHLARTDDEGIDPAAWRRRLYEEVAALVRLACSEMPVVWIIEDVQWMDETSASLLHYITRRLEGAPFLLIATARVPRGGSLPDALPVTVPRTGAPPRSVRLVPLSASQIRQILAHARPDAAVHPAVELAQRLSGGNPFFALEVFRAAVLSSEWAEEAGRWDPLTNARLSQVLAVRFEGLTRPAVGLLQATAVLERHASPGAVSKVAGIPLAAAAEHAEELYRRNLLVDAEGGLEFVNDIIREYVYSEMSALQRAALHLAAAEHLLGEPCVGAATLARHWHLGEDRPRTYKYAISAAREAEESGGQREAAAMAELALAAAESPEQRLQALHLLAEAELESAQLTVAREHFDEILRLDTTMPLERRIGVKLRVVEILAELSEWAEGTRVLTEVARDVGSISDPSRQLLNKAESLFWGLKIAIRQNDARAAEAVAKASRVLQERAVQEGDLTDEARTGALLCMAAYSAFFESSREALACLDEIGPELANLPSPVAERIHLFRGMVALRMARWDEGEYEIKQALGIAGKRNDLVQLTSHWNNLACCALEQGDWISFDQRLSQAEAILDELQDPLDAALPLTINRANSFFYQSKAKEAHNYYRRALEIAEMVGSKEFIIELLSCTGLVDLQLGNRASAEKVWRTLQDTRQDQFVGSQERFKFEWFRAYMLQPLDPEKAFRTLYEVAEDQSSLDVPSHLKLLWLGCLLFGEGAFQKRISTQGTRDKLRRAGLAWFASFSGRWLRSARAHRLGV